MPELTAIKVWYAGKGRDYALLADGGILSVNAVGLKIMDVRWVVVQADGEFVGDSTDKDCLEKAGYVNVQRYKKVIPPCTS